MSSKVANNIRIRAAIYVTSHLQIEAQENTVNDTLRHMGWGGLICCFVEMNIR